MVMMVMVMVMMVVMMMEKRPSVLVERPLLGDLVRTHTTDSSPRHSRREHLKTVSRTHSTERTDPASVALGFCFALLRRCPREKFGAGFCPACVTVARFSPSCAL